MLQRFGSWDTLRSVLRAGERVSAVSRKALLEEAHQLRKLIVQGLTKQAPGDEPIRPIAKLTQATRKLRRFGGTKALLVRADLRNSIAVVANGDTAFVGVLRRTRTRNGHLTDLAAVHEFGGPPTIIPVTPKMRRFLGVLLRHAGVPRQKSQGVGKNFILLVVPPRPFLRPAWGLFQKSCRLGFARRFVQGLGWEGLL